MVISGAGGLAEIARQYEKVFLVHGRAYGGSAAQGALDGVQLVEFTDFSPNPKYEEALRGARLFNEAGCDAIVAVGGGSAIDVAKCVKLFCRMDSGGDLLAQEWRDPGIPLVAVPTTAGSGSEATRHAAIYRDGGKKSISHDCILPDYAVLIPELLGTLPDYQKKCAMLDALCQSVESAWSLGATAESREYAGRAIALIRDNWRGYILSGDGDAAARILSAANLSGRAINISETTAAHAMSYKLTSLYGLPHGHAVALCLGEVWEYNRAHAGDAAREGGGLERAIDEVESLVSLEWFRDLLRELGMGSPRAGDREAEIELLARSASPERMRNNPVAIGVGELKRMYGRIVM